MAGGFCGVDDDEQWLQELIEYNREAGCLPFLGTFVSTNFEYRNTASAFWDPGRHP